MVKKPVKKKKVEAKKVVTKKVEVKKVKTKKAKQIGVISNYFQHVKAAAIKLSAPLKKGDKIKIVGGEDKEILMVVESMQIDRKDIDSAKKGDEIGLLVPDDVHKGNKVYQA
jgi:hypothetical protein